MNTTILEIFVFIFCLIVVNALLLVPVIHGTIVKNKWGINTKDVAYCPHCKTKFPKTKFLFWVTPKSQYEAMWGGWTCHVCGTRIDKWGRVRDEQ
ncbi:MAG: hypothetical protein P8Y80_09205 [Acidobacteriota bacterium]